MSDFKEKKRNMTYEIIKQIESSFDEIAKDVSDGGMYAMKIDENKDNYVKEDLISSLSGKGISLMIEDDQITAVKHY